MRNIGPRAKPFLRFRSGGASTARLCLRFLVRLLTTHYETLNAVGSRGTALLRAGLLMRRVYTLLAAAEKRALVDVECGELADTMVAALTLIKNANIHQYPKNHMCVHLAKQARSATL